MIFSRSWLPTTQQLSHARPRWRWMSGAALSLTTVGLLAAPTIAFPSFNLVNKKDYQKCAEGLRQAGVGEALTAQACAGVTRPRFLAECVTSIQETGQIASEEAVVSCVSVRRPRELGVCVSDIIENGQGVDPSSVLYSCSRSLLPERYSFCVIGLAQNNTSVAVDQLLEICLNPPEQFVDIEL